MVELNLLPQALKEKRKKIELPEIPVVPIAIGLIGVYAAVYFLAGGLVFLNKKQFAALRAEWRNLAPEKSALDRIKAKISETGRKNETVENLIEKRLNWARLLNELSGSLTADIWLTELSYSGKRAAKPNRRAKGEGALKLFGSAWGSEAEATASIARFIKALKHNKNFFRDFNDIELVSIKQGSVAGQNVMNFTLMCRFKPEETES